MLGKRVIGKFLAVPKLTTYNRRRCQSYSRPSRSVVMFLSHQMVNRRGFFAGCVAGAAIAQAELWARRVVAQEAPRDVYFERAAEGTPHHGEVWLSVQAQADDIAVTAPGGVGQRV